MNNTDQLGKVAMNDALAEMQSEMTASETATQQPLSDSDASSLTQVGESLDYNTYLIKTPEIIKQIDDLMGDFFNSIKNVNIQFASYADAFYENARKISYKDKITEDEFNEMAVSQIAGMTINGIANLWNSIRMMQNLNTIKKFLAREATNKLQDIKDIDNIMPEIVNAAVAQYYKRYEDGADCQKLYDAFNAMRLTLYSQNLVTFLVATYEAALENKFQNEVTYPNMYDMNAWMLNILIGDDDKLSSDEAKLAKYRANIKTLIERMTQTMKSNSAPSPEECILAMDQGIMGVAIHDCYPLSLTTAYEDGFVTVDEESFLPASAEFYHEFYNLYATAEENPIHPLANALLNNGIFTETINNYAQFHKEANKFGKRNLWMNINVILIAALAFVSGMYNDWKWYWATLFAFAVGSVFAMLSPFKSTKKRFLKKVTYIERTIQKSSLVASGYVETLDLKAIEIKNRKGYLLAFLGLCLGAIFGPIGAIVGALVGFGIAGGFNDDDPDEEDYDHTKVKTGNMFVVYFMTILLTAAIIAVIVKWIQG